jgi:uncharacterized protein (TIGR03435 family)
MLAIATIAIVVVPLLLQTISQSMSFALGAASVAQTQPLAFEVASIKPNTSGRPSNVGPINAAGGRFFASDATLRMLLQFAYRPPDGRTLRGIDIIDAPGWADTDGFDIQAKAPSEALQVSQDQMRLMVQSLLADRFRLKTHWTPREIDVYNLVVSKGGPKLKRSENQSDPPRATAMPSHSGITLTFTDGAKSIGALADWLQPYVRRPVIDKTGLEGLFAVRLQFRLESLSAVPGADPLDSALPPDPSGPSIFNAVEEQVGLKFESAKASLDVLVLDHVEKPSEN